MAISAATATKRAQNICLPLSCKECKLKRKTFGFFREHERSRTNWPVIIYRNRIIKTPG